jgi:tetratricopeptide (TPR) repeat protein
MFLVKNNENFTGSKIMYNHIANSSDYKVSKENTDIICAITRFPSHDEDKENATLDEFKKKIDNPILKREDIFIIHSDREVEYEELFIIKKKQDSKRQIIGDYLKIIDKIVDKDLVRRRNVSKPKYRFIKNDLDSLAKKELSEKDNEKFHQYQALFKYALYERNAGNIIRSVANLCEIIDSDDELKSKALYWRGIIFLYDFSNYKDAESDLKTVYGIQEAVHPCITYDLAACCFCLDKYDEALEYVEKYIDDNGRDFRGFLLRANLNKEKIDKKNITLIEKNKIISDFNKAIEIDNNYAPAYNSRGLFYFELGENEKVLEDYSKAIEIDAGFATAYNNRGILYSKLGENEKALEDYNKAIEIDADYAPAYNNRGNLYYKLEENEKALEDYDKAIEINPDLKIAHSNRENLYSKLGLPKKTTDGLNNET